MILHGLLHNIAAVAMILNHQVGRIMVVLQWIDYSLITLWPTFLPEVTLKYSMWHTGMWHIDLLLTLVVFPAVTATSMSQCVTSHSAYKSNTI